MRLLPHLLSFVLGQFLGQRPLNAPADPDPRLSTTRHPAARDGASEANRRLRVLYALEKYPQLSQSYIRAEIACARRWGAHVEVWSEGTPPSPYPSAVPLHRGALEDAIADVGPHVIHTHWLHKACD